MRFHGLTTAFMVFASAAHAQENQAITGVIGAQLQHFTERDVAGAWAFASPTIQQMFGNWQNFGAMVQQGYPMVWDHSEVQFLGLQDVNGLQVQRVLIRDSSGLPHILEYAMIETTQGWRIAGVSLLPAPDIGA